MTSTFTGERSTLNQAEDTYGQRDSPVVAEIAPRVHRGRLARQSVVRRAARPTPPRRTRRAEPEVRRRPRADGLQPGELPRRRGAEGQRPEGQRGQHVASK